MNCFLKKEEDELYLAKENLSGGVHWIVWSREPTVHLCGYHYL
jgi:hypothetical protein